MPDDQTISWPSRRTTLLALSIDDVKNIGSFLSDTPNTFTMAITCLTEVDRLDDQHTSLRELQWWLIAWRDVKAIVYLPDDTHIAVIKSIIINLYNGPRRRVSAAAP
jgi:hypothetical protein